MRGAEQPEKGGLAAALGRISDGLTRVVSEHLALARAELRDDGRALALDAVRILVFLPLVIVGYGLLCAGLAVALSAWIGLALSFAIVGGVNVLVGGVGAALAATKLKQRPVLESTRVEVTRTTQALANVARPSNGPSNGPSHGVERRLGA